MNKNGTLNLLCSQSLYIYVIGMAVQIMLRLKTFSGDALKYFSGETQTCNATFTFFLHNIEVR